MYKFQFIRHSFFAFWHFAFINSKLQRGRQENMGRSKEAMTCNKGTLRLCGMHSNHSANRLLHLPCIFSIIRHIKCHKSENSFHILEKRFNLFLAESQMRTSILLIFIE